MRCEEDADTLGWAVGEDTGRFGPAQKGAGPSADARPLPHTSWVPLSLHLGPGGVSRARSVNRAGGRPPHWASLLHQQSQGQR